MSIVVTTFRMQMHKGVSAKHELQLLLSRPYVKGPFIPLLSLLVGERTDTKPIVT